MRKYIYMLVIGFAANAMAQTSTELQYAAYLNASKTMWEKSIKEAELDHGTESFEKAMALYGTLNNTMATQDEETFNQYKEETIDLLKSIIDQNEKWGEPRAVLSSVYGLVMAYNPMKGMFLGMKSSSLMEEAMKLQPESPLVQKLYAGSKLYTPEMWGGDAEKAVTSFQRSIALFDQGNTQNNWLYLDSMMGLSLAYRKTEEHEKAVDTLEKAIEIEPNYYWAIGSLKKLKSKS